MKVFKSDSRGYESPQIEAVSLDTPLCVETLSNIWDNDPLITDDVEPF